MKVDFPLSIRQDLFNNQKDSFIFFPQNSWTRELSQSDDLIWDLASLTKVYVTALMSVLQTAKKKNWCDRKVSYYEGSFKKPGLDDLCLLDLLTHTSGLRPWLPLFRFDSKTHGCVASIIAEYGIRPDQSREKLYSDLNYQVIGRILEKENERELNELVESLIAFPLGLETFGFLPLRKHPVRKIVPSAFGQQAEKDLYLGNAFDLEGEILTKEFPKERKGLIQGEVHDHNCFSFFNGVAGHAGLFSSMGDLYRLNQKLMDNSSKSFLTSAQQELFFGTKKHTPLGLNDAKTDPFLARFPQGSLAHFGFTGVFSCLHPETGKQWILLSSRHLGQHKARSTKDIVSECLAPTKYVHP